MRDRKNPMRKAVERIRQTHEQIAHDRLLAEGKLGDEELTSLLMVPYPTLLGQLN